RGTLAAAVSPRAQAHAHPESLHSADATLLLLLPKTPATQRNACSGSGARLLPPSRASPRQHHGPSPVQSLPLVRSSSHFFQTIPKFHHLAAFKRRGTSRSISSFASNSARPRCSRERMVPIGQPVICAASS